MKKHQFKATLYSLLIIGGLLAFQYAQAVNIPNPLGAVQDPRVIIGKILRGVLGLIGTYALVIFMWGGLDMIRSMGNYEMVKKGRDTMAYAAIGLAVIFSSYAVVEYILSKVIAAGAA